MTFIVISGFYPDTNPDNSLQYERTVPQGLELEILTAMGWESLADVPMGESDLTQDQTVAIMAVLGDPIKDDLIYCLGLYS
jgi:hypothetical protein